VAIPVRIKRSNTNGTPASLLEGELAFSNDYLTHTGDGSLYIGADDDGGGVVVRKIGGTDVFQALFETITCDTGSFAADSATNILEVLGGTGVSTVATDAAGTTTVTITNDSPNVAQDLFATITGDTGSFTADGATNVLAILGAGDISTVITDAVGTTTCTISYTGTGQPDQNLFETITGDSGTFPASGTTDTLEVLGGTGISTAVTDSTSTTTITVTNDDPNVDQNLFSQIDADVGTTVSADGTTNILSLLGGTDIQTTVSDVAGTTTVTFDYNGAADPDQNLFEIIGGDTGTDVTAATASDKLDIVGAGLITTTVSDSGTTTTLSIATTATGDQNLFDTIGADTGVDVDAGGTSDRLDITGGTGITTTVSDTGTTTTVDIVNDSPNIVQDAFTTVDCPNGTDPVANGNADTLQFLDGTDITITGNVTADSVTIAYTGAAEANQDVFGIVTGNSGTATADATVDTIAITGTGLISTTATAGASAALSISTTAEANVDAFGVVTGDTGSASADGDGDTVNFAGGMGIVTLASEEPDDLDIAISPTKTVTITTGTWDFTDASSTLTSRTPTADAEVATKSYVDAVAQGLDTKESVVFASTADLSGTYSSTGGASARGQFTAMSDVPIDGVTLTQGDRLLLKDQTGSGAENGIWVITTLGTGGNGVWDRATDFDEDSEVTSAAFVFVEEGTANGNTGWTLTTNDPIIIGGASGTVLVWAQFSGAGTYIAGVGLDLNGSTFNVYGGQSGQVLVGDTVTTNAAWGALPLANTNSVSGILPGSHGGTGIASPALNGFLYGSAGDTMNVLATPSGAAGTSYIMSAPSDGGTPVWLTEIDGGTYP